MENQTIKIPSAIIRSGLRSYVALPVLGAYDLRPAFADLVCEQAGEGQQVAERDGTRVYCLVVENTHDERFPLGAWVVRYSLHDQYGSAVEGVWLAAEVS